MSLLIDAHVAAVNDRPLVGEPLFVDVGRAPIGLYDKKVGLKVSAADKRRLEAKFEAAKATKFEHVKLKLSTLRVERIGYQVELDEERVEAIIADFSPIAVNPIVVSVRVIDGEEVYFIVNGQHTGAALSHLGYKTADCILVRDLTPEDEAKLYLVLNSRKTHVAPAEKKSFPALVSAGVGWAVDLQKLLKETNTNLFGRHKNTFPSLPTLKRTFKLDHGTSLKRAIFLGRRIWPACKIPGGVIDAIAGINFGCGGSLHEDRMVDVLGTMSPMQWANVVAETYKGNKPNSLYMPRCYAFEFISAYNDGLKFTPRKTAGPVRLDENIPTNEDIFKQFPERKKKLKAKK
jgi:uncharacterized ParB-like nuclease family protein